MMVREKSHIMSFYEVVYRRLNDSQIRDELHPMLYDGTKKNELTKKLIEIAMVAKAASIPKFAEMCTDNQFDDGKLVMEGSINAELPEINSAYQVQVYYSQVAYSLLSSVVVCTMKKETDYAECLFKPSSEGTESMWPLLIDCRNTFSFEV